MELKERLIEMGERTVGIGKKNPSFYRLLRNLPSKDQEELRQRFQLTPKKTTVSRQPWSDAEYEKVIEAVWKALTQNPTTTLSDEIQMAQQSLTPDRRRPRSHYLLNDIANRIKPRYEAVEQILDGLSIDEKIVYFADEVLKNLTEDEFRNNLSFIPIAELAAYVVKRILTPANLEQGNQGTGQNHRTRKLKIAVIGPG